MKIIWFTLIVKIIIITLIKPLIIDFEGIGIFAVLVHVLISVIILLSFKGKYKSVFTSAYLTRVIFMFWDLYARHIFILPGSGEDTEWFYRVSVNLSEDISFLLKSGSELYPKLIGFLFYFIGPQRILAQYINVLLGLSVVFIVYKILKMLEIDTKVENKILIIITFFPNSLVMSAIFLREMFTTFFVATSLYYFIKWFKTPKYSNMILVLLMLGIACMFHSGVIGILLGYVFAFLFYEKDEKEFKFSSKTIISFVLILIVFSAGYTYFGGMILRKFGSGNDMGYIFEITNNRGGGSDYLTWLNIDNPIQLVLFGPLKAFFFLTAPLPMNWRGFLDVFTFFFDSYLYISVIMYFYINRKRFGNRKQLIIIIALMIVGAAIIFGVGVNNAGTALRHRQKLVPLFVMLLGAMMDGKKYLKEKNLNYP